MKHQNSDEGMSRRSFKIMAAVFNLRDIFGNTGKKLDSFGIKPGSVIVDYGCGTGSYLKRASELAGPDGKVYAVDRLEISIETVTKRIKKEGLANVLPVLADAEKSNLESHLADLIYALDMFHMVKRPGRLLAEFKRILKHGGRLILEDGHQPRSETLMKVSATGQWKIVKETPGYLECVPVD